MIKTKHIQIILFLSCFITSKSVYSCINEYRSLLNGQLSFKSIDNPTPRGRFNSSDKEFLIQKLQEADSIYQLTKKIEDYSDLGALMVYTGQYNTAKKIFLEIERRQPRLYHTAANLGTTYELLGSNDSALHWIRQAIAINPKSHNGSEWIHIKILEAKVRAKNDETYLWKENVLGLDFGDDKIPINKNTLSLDILENHLYHQLNERMTFIKPKDPIMAQLLFELGNVYAISKDVKSGLQAYQAAHEYGYHSELFELRQSYFKKLQRKADFKNNIEKWEIEHSNLLLFISGIILILGIWIIVKMVQFIKKRIRK